MKRVFYLVSSAMKKRKPLFYILNFFLTGYLFNYNLYIILVFQNRGLLFKRLYGRPKE